MMEELSNKNTGMLFRNLELNARKEKNKIK